MNYLAIGLAVVTAFVVSAIYYSVFSKQLGVLKPEAYAEAPGQPLPTVLVELVRNLVLAGVLAGFASEMGIEEWTGGALLGLAAWIGFPVVLWSGSVFHEKVPWKLAAIHAGDWLVKLVAVGIIVGAW